MDAELSLDYKLRLWAPTSASRVISAVAELLVSHGVRKCRALVCVLWSRFNLRASAVFSIRLSFSYESLLFSVLNGDKSKMQFSSYDVTLSLPRLL